MRGNKAKNPVHLTRWEIALNLDENASRIQLQHAIEEAPRARERERMAREE